MKRFNEKGEEEEWRNRTPVCLGVGGGGGLFCGHVHGMSVDEAGKASGAGTPFSQEAGTQPGKRAAVGNGIGRPGRPAWIGPVGRVRLPVP